MPATEALLLFTLVAGIAGMDLAKTHPLTAGGTLLGAIHAVLHATVTGFGWASGDGLWWMAAIMLPAAFWAVAIDVMQRTRKELGIHLSLWGFQSLWFTTAVIVLWSAGGSPSFGMALGLSLLYGVPLMAGVWATTNGSPLDRIESRWQVLVLILSAAMLMAMLASLPDRGFVLAFFLLAIVWGTIRYGRCLDDGVKVRREVTDEDWLIGLSE